MIEYYKLMFVRKEKGNLGVPEELILEIDRDKSSVLYYKSEKPGVKLVASKIERITDEVVESILQNLYGEK